MPTDIRGRLSRLEQRRIGRLALEAAVVIATPEHSRDDIADFLRQNDIDSWRRPTIIIRGKSADPSAPALSQPPRLI